IYILKQEIEHLNTLLASKDSHIDSLKQAMLLLENREDQRQNTELARLEAEKAEERRRNACATAERRRRKLEKLQATGGTAGQ
ncbi:hypothetical protein ACSLOY_28550, partial [Klebsiella pneumoniae]